MENWRRRNSVSLRRNFDKRALYFDNCTLLTSWWLRVRIPHLLALEWFSVFSAPTLARLGVTNLATGDGGGSAPADIAIKRFIQFDGYDRLEHWHDIALIELANDVTFNKSFVRPACLQQNEISEEKLVAVSFKFSVISAENFHSDDWISVRMGENFNLFRSFWRSNEIWNLNETAELLRAQIGSWELAERKPAVWLVGQQSKLTARVKTNY